MQTDGKSGAGVINVHKLKNENEKKNKKRRVSVLMHFPHWSKGVACFRTGVTYFRCKVELELHFPQRSADPLESLHKL